LQIERRILGAEHPDTLDTMNTLANLEYQHGNLARAEVLEVFSYPLEVVPLVKDRLIDFIRCRVAATGGITPIKKLTTLCEIFGVRTAFQEGGENDPINQISSYHIDISSTAFGIQEENHFPPIVHEMFPGIGEIRRGYFYGSGKPGLGIDIDETLAAKNPLGPIKNGGAYDTDRTIDGAVVKP
jgi:mannonate dehydratase